MLEKIQKSPEPSYRQEHTECQAGLLFQFLLFPSLTLGCQLMDGNKISPLAPFSDTPARNELCFFPKFLP